MNVFILWHDPRDDESSPELRGIYTSREAAEADLPVEPVEYPDHCETRAHDTDCCWVNEEPLLSAPIGAGPLPKYVLYGPHPTLGHLLNRRAEEAIHDAIARTNPFRHLASREREVREKIAR